jgi:hypothetical protein
MKTPRPKGDFSFVVVPGLHELVAVHDGPHPNQVGVFEIDGAVVNPDHDHVVAHGPGLLPGLIGLLPGLGVDN